MSNEVHEQRRVTETATTYGTAVADLKAPLILESEGQPVAVILPFDEYERLIQMAASDQERRGVAWTSLASLLEDIRQRSTSLTLEQIAAEITLARDEVRAAQRGIQCVTVSAMLDRLDAANRD